ncbi:MAG: hypothetical protein IPG45_05875 [Deltaproteobacteria bacterium]|nr:hypothetical protein [Deltaproteobacteria bacterium]
MPDLGVHDARSRCPRCPDLGVHDAPKSATIEVAGARRDYAGRQIDDWEYDVDDANIKLPLALRPPKATLTCHVGINPPPPKLTLFFSTDPTGVVWTIESPDLHTAPPVVTSRTELAQAIRSQAAALGHQLGREMCWAKDGDNAFGFHLEVRDDVTPDLGSVKGLDTETSILVHMFGTENYT